MKSILKNTSWLLLEKAVTMVLNLFLAVILARQLGVEDFGTLNFILAIIAILTPISTVGINAILSRDFLASPEKEPVIFSSGTTLRFAGTVFFSILIVTFCYFKLTLSNALFEIFVILVLLNVTNFFQGLEFWFQAKLKMKPLVVSRLIVFVTFSALKIFTSLEENPLHPLLLIYGIEACFRGVTYYVVYLTNKGKLSLYFFEKSYAQALIKNSFWLFLSGIAAVIYLKIDQVMLSELAGHEENGIYSVAVRLSEVWYFFSIALVSSVFPSLIRARKNSYSEYYNKLQYCNDALCWSAVIIAVLVSLVAPYFISFIFGEEYAGSSLILSIHIWGAVFVFMRSLVSKWILAENLLKVSLYSQGIGAISNILFNYYLIPNYGGVGAAVATVGSYIFSGWLIFYFSASTRPVAYMIHKSLMLPFYGADRYLPILRKISWKKY